MTTHSIPIRADQSAKTPRSTAETRPSDDASNGWFESTWDLWHGLDVREGLPPELGSEDAMHAYQAVAQRHQTLTNYSGVELKAYFDLKSSGAERFSFKLKAGNHEVILTSRVYRTKEDALEAVDSVRKNAADPSRYDRQLATDNSLYFVLLAESGETIGRSEMHSSSAARESGIASVMKDGPTTSVKGLD